MFKLNYRNKRAVSGSIGILVVVTLLLTVLSIFSFLKENSNINKEMLVSDSVDLAYFEKIQLDYILEDIFNKAAAGFNVAQGKEVFINQFKSEMADYKLVNGDYGLRGLKGVEGQLVESNVEVSEDSLVLNLELEVQGHYVSEEDLVIVNYNYKKRLEKVFK